MAGRRHVLPITIDRRLLDESRRAMAFAKAAGLPRSTWPGLIELGAAAMRARVIAHCKREGITLEDLAERVERAGGERASWAGPDDVAPRVDEP